MDLSYTAAEEEFRQTVRAWLAVNVPKHKSGGEEVTLQERRDWQRKLYQAGYVALSWPKEYGGQDMDVIRQSIVQDELIRARAPGLVGQSGLVLLGPTLITWGTAEQKARYLPKLLIGEEIWCQGYSEPGAGSDLASLRTRAEIDGDEFVVTGQKVWTSGAKTADMMFCLVRTDPTAPKHRGISYLLIDMKTPGLDVRPLKQMTGEMHFNEVFFDNARVPRRNLVGKLNEGWTVANSTLFHERNALGSTVVSRTYLRRLKEMARTIQRHAQPLIQDPLFRQQLAELESRVEAMHYHLLRQLSDEAQGRKHAIESTVNKLVGTELNYELAKLAMDAMGDYALLMRDEEQALSGGWWPVEWMFSLALVTGGGTSQIQKNIISERGLKMPK